MKAEVLYKCQHTPENNVYFMVEKDDEEYRQERIRTIAKIIEVESKLN